MDGFPVQAIPLAQEATLIDVHHRSQHPSKTDLLTTHTMSTNNKDKLVIDVTVYVDHHPNGKDFDDPTYDSGYCAGEACEWSEPVPTLWFKDRYVSSIIKRRSPTD